MLNMDEVLEYIDKLPSNSLIEGLDQNALKQNVFDAYEDIHSLYPTINITERMIVKQMLYKLEGENNGYAMLKRQGVQSQKINDASVTLSKQILDPYVLFLIEQQAPTSSVGHIGRLI